MITHDLGVVAETCDHVVVMYAAHVAENADVYSLFENPCHPYTIALFKSIPDLVGGGGRLFTIDGMVPSAYNFPQGSDSETAVHLPQSSASRNPKWKKWLPITSLPVTTGEKPKPSMPKKTLKLKEQNDV